MHLKWSCVFDSIAWWNNCSLTRISFSHKYCTPNLNPLKTLFLFHISCMHKRIFWKMKFVTKNANFLLLIWPVYIVIVPSYFLFFVIFVIYRPRFCPFVHFVIVNPIYFLFLWSDFVNIIPVIVLYCIYAFWVVITRRI